MADKAQEYLAEALRTRKNPVNPKLQPIELRSRGYQLYVQEQKALGETPASYEEWMKTQTPLGE
jgi:hypothetical protein